VDARFVADGLTKAWGRQVVIVSHAGANGSIAARAARADTRFRRRGAADLAAAPEQD
jgi:tripartite-type tricarboxylate transporter receptor subunit TctC